MCFQWQGQSVISATVSGFMSSSFMSTWLHCIPTSSPVISNLHPLHGWFFLNTYWLLVFSLFCLTHLFSVSGSVTSFSSWWLLLLWHKALGCSSFSVCSTGLSSLVPRTQSTGSIDVACWLTCPSAGGIFLDRGLNLCLPHWQSDSLPLNHREAWKCFMLNFPIWKNLGLGHIQSSDCQST